MTEAEVISQMRAHLERQFPKSCPSCGRRFASLREYLQAVSHLGSAMPYDADMGVWRPSNPVGTATYANCPCGNTLALTSAGMPLSQLWTLLAWARNETRARRQTPQELLNYLRDKIWQQVLQPVHQEGR
jgi:hypothetical protein